MCCLPAHVTPLFAMKCCQASYFAWNCVSSKFTKKHFLENILCRLAAFHLLGTLALRAINLHNHLSSFDVPHWLLWDFEIVSCHVKSLLGSREMLSLILRVRWRRYGNAEVIFQIVFVRGVKISGRTSAQQVSCAAHHARFACRLQSMLLSRHRTHTWACCVVCCAFIRYTSFTAAFYQLLTFELSKSQLLDWWRDWV